jgi:uncharacterized protein
MIENPDDIAALVKRVHTVAVLGIKIPSDRPAYTVPESMQRAGYEIIPVPVYFPEVTEILGRRVYRSVSAIPGPVDLVQIFRRATDIPAHVDDIIAKHPSAVWMQLGIRNEAAAARFEAAGIAVVQDRCFTIELARLGR